MLLCYFAAIAIMHPPMAGTILSILMLAGAALTGGGIHAIAKRGERKRGALMIVAGLVMFANVAMATIPMN